MSSDVLFERDMLYPADTGIEPGSVHIRVYGPDNNARIPIVIEGRSGHSPLDYIDTIIRIMQSDIFDRVFIDVKKNADIYIKADNRQTNGGHSHIRVRFTGNAMECEGVDL